MTWLEPARSLEPPRSEALVQSALELREHRETLAIARLDHQRLVHLFDGLVDATFRRVHAGQVHVREVAQLVAWRLLGLLEPADRVIELALLVEVRADVVVGIAEA